mmetsp:Transcript_44541/g.146055  ORF Transcript_44541/g.146055 Transcript_44541/m.146055 type:complete len:202 (+) Transcript_44541:619-1224(+)
MSRTASTRAQCQENVTNSHARNVRAACAITRRGARTHGSSHARAHTHTVTHTHTHTHIHTHHSHSVNTFRQNAHPPSRVALIIISRRRATDTRRQSHISLPTPHTATCAIVNAVMGARGGAGVSRARTRDPPHAPVQRDARCAHRRRVERTTVAAAARRHRALCPSTPQLPPGGRRRRPPPSRRVNPFEPIASSTEYDIAL